MLHPYFIYHNYDMVIIRSVPKRISINYFFMLFITVEAIISRYKNRDAMLHPYFIYVMFLLISCYLQVRQLLQGGL